MSSNKTVIPGVDNSSTPFTSSIPTGTPTSAPFTGGTVIPGVNPGVSIPKQPVNSKPVVGFLYSISRTGRGEYWPLHVGPNTIGRSKSCDIYLPEATVSEQHAEFVVHLMKNPEKVIAAIFDQRSTCGTMINGESLGFEPRECINGDIITIGEHYDLYVILIDVKQLGLSTCPSFIPTEIEQNTPQVPPVVPDSNNGGGGRTQFYPGQYGNPTVQQQGMPATPPPPPFYQAPGNAGTMPSSGDGRTEPGRTIFM